MLKKFGVVLAFILFFPTITNAVEVPVEYVEPVLNTNEETAHPLIAEPSIRVGLYKTSETVEWQSDFSYRIFSGMEEKGTIEPDTKVKLNYKKGKYIVTSENLNFESSEPLRLIPEDNNSFFILTNYKRPVSWKGNKNFNVYRGIMEYKYSPRSAKPYIINELLLDQYVAGIGETVNSAPLEYIKAILVAARSYAFFHLNFQVRDEKYMFDVYASTVDQLYLGYNSEVMMPRVVQAGQDTYGEMVTYDHNPVVAPYFANSDGKTRLWSKVWGGQNKPWIQPVECIYDKGKKKYGHGVGMSAADAAARADKDGWTYDQLLKYYYTGVDVERIY